MPEWPEMEHYRTQLSSLVSGKKITGAVVNREATVNEPAEQFIASLATRTILFVERRGKHLLFHLDDGNRLVLHLMLGGWIFYGERAPKDDDHYQVIVRLADGNSLYFGGLRLGFLHRMTAKAALEQMKQLGPEPFDARLTPEAFRKRLSGKRGRLKSTLTDQKFIAGIGNCYSDEICFAAKLHPATACSDLNEEQAGRLYEAMKTVLLAAKEAGGYMEQPLTADDAVTGGYNDRCLVYDRGGEPCGECGHEIKHETLSGRKMFYCPHCQGNA
ncbi:bifunctional DNA-formamidopyrimidine glycosylase/DNA-(apurinic or apyrimidinic site) lyase [Cohnella sp. GCM10027633]|uniref:bifunctional DNA-formamidopyrimidine glycosylase/DNA-(apurinic or apyrimidinic site) lyase n=1 Tax=unclassified Cohnella TaxID=2636738 RepID=UPI003633302D